MLLHNSIVRCFVLPCDFDSRCSRILVARNIFQAVARINWRSLLFLHIQPRARVKRQQWQNTKDWYSKQPREELKQRRKTSLVTLCNTLAQFKSAEPSIDQVFLESFGKNQSAARNGMCVASSLCWWWGCKSPRVTQLVSISATVRKKIFGHRSVSFELALDRSLERINVLQISADLIR